MSSTPSSDDTDHSGSDRADAHQPPGSDPASTPGLDAGNSVEPGDTPPDSGVGMDRGGTPAHPRQPEKPPSKAPIYIIGTIIVVALLLFFIGHIAGLIG